MNLKKYKDFLLLILHFWEGSQNLYGVLSELNVESGSIYTDMDPLLSLTLSFHIQLFTLFINFSLLHFSLPYTLIYALAGSIITVLIWPL